MIPQPTDPMHAYGLVLLSGLAFGLLELLLDFTVKDFIRIRFKAGNDDHQAKLNATLALGRIVGWIHNSVQVVLGLIVLVDPVMRADTIRASSDASRAVMLIAAGFFTYDTVICAKRVKQEGWQYLLHAVLCCAGYSSAFCFNTLHYYGSAYIMWECSTFFVHARWFLFNLGMGKSPAYDLNAKLLFLAFFACRIVWGTFISTHFWFDLGKQMQWEAPPLSNNLVAVYRAVVLACNCLNYYWFKLMLDKVLAVARGKRFHEVSKVKDG